MPALEVIDLATSFQTDDGTVRAVAGVSFSVDKGRTLGVVGESGSGKSVTFLTLMGLLDPRLSQVSGSVLLHGEEMLGISQSRLRQIRGAKIGMIFQDPMTSLNPVKTIGWQLEEAALLHQDITRKEARRQAVQILKEVEIPFAEQRVRDYPHQFSGGMRQRVMIAMALVHNPDVLIADEPTTALDVTVQAQILELIDEVKKEFNIGVILVTHDLGVVAETANSVLVMYAGRVMEYGPASQVFELPQHPYAWGLLDSMPTVERRLEQLVPIEGSPPSLIAPPAGCPFHPRCPYVFGPCPTERPPLVAPVPEAHLDACHLPWERKVELGKKRSIARLGEPA